MAVSEEARREAAQSLFSAFDLDGNGVVGLNELLQVVQSSRRVGDKQHMKRVRMLEAEIRQGVELRKRTGVNSVNLKSGGAINFSATDGEPSLDPAAFTNFIVGFTAKDTQQEFDAFVSVAKQGVEDALERTAGTSFRRSVWAMFQLLDVNQDGFVDLNEMEAMLKAESKDDKKHLSKWRAIAAQRKLEAGSSLAPVTSTAEAEALASMAVTPESTVVVSTPTTADKEKLRLTLHDFQQFMEEYTDNDEKRLEALLGRVRDTMQAEYGRYLQQYKVNDIIDAVVDDLIRERPHDVLDGIIRSCERMKRTGTYARSGLRRVQSSVTVRDLAKRAGSQSPGQATLQVPGTEDADNEEPKPL